MEVMDVCLSTAMEVFYQIASHPIYSAVGSVVIFTSLFRLYCKLTLGVCDCDDDMTRKTVLITGATAGIGKATAYDMARRNARVLLACRNVEKANKLAEEIKSSTGNPKIVVLHLDLCSFASVRKCAQDVLDTEERQDVLINNAGILAMGMKKQITEDGYETIMQSNHLGHFLLTLLLLDLVKRSSPSRIINVSSSSHSIGKLEDLTDLRNDKNRPPLSVYANSKLANVLFTVELAQRLMGTGVTVNAVHPGMVNSDVWRGCSGLFAYFVSIFGKFAAKSNEEGAQTSIYAAVHPDLEKTTGKYFMDCKEEPVKDELLDMAVAKSFFELSEKAVGVSFNKT